MSHPAPLPDAQPSGGDSARASAPAPAGPPPSSSSRRGLASLGSLLVLFGVVLVVLRTGFAVSPGEQFQRNQVWASDVVLSLIASWLLWQGGRSGLEAWRARTGSESPAEREARLLIRDRLVPFLGLFVAFALPQVLWFIGEWPGHLDSDEQRSLFVFSRHEVEPWLSTLWGLYAGGLYRVSGQFTLPAVLNLLLLSWVLADVFSLMLRHGLSRKVAGVFVLLLMTSIPVGVMSTFLSHDILTGYLKLSLVAVLLRMLVRGALLKGGPGSTGGSLALLTGLVLATSLLRGENIALFLYVPALLLLTRQARPLAVGLMLVVLVSGNLFFRRVLEPQVSSPWYQSPDRHNRYALTLLLNPLGFLVNNNYSTPTPDEDQRAIDAVVDWACISNHPDLTEPDCYWTSLRPPVTDEKMAAVKRVYIRAVLGNPVLFISNRVAVFLGQFGLNGKPSYPFFFEREKKTDAELYGEHAALVHDAGLRFERDNASVLSRITRRVRDWSFPQHGLLSPGFWVWNALPAFMLLVFLAATWRRNPISAALAGVLLVPLALVFGGAPASHVTYVTDLWVFGYLAIPLLVFERTVLKPRGATARAHTTA